MNAHIQALFWHNICLCLNMESAPLHVLPNYCTNHGAGANNRARVDKIRPLRPHSTAILSILHYNRLNCSSKKSVRPHNAHSCNAQITSKQDLLFCIHCKDESQALKISFQTEKAVYKVPKEINMYTHSSVPFMTLYRSLLKTSQCHTEKRNKLLSRCTKRRHWTAAASFHFSLLVVKKLHFWNRKQ